MAEKEIIMKLGTDADLTILEKYRDLMHDVLGTYEENIKDLTTLNQEIKRYQGTISDLNQVEAKNRALTEDEIQEREIATKTVRNLQIAKSELLQTIKEQEKFMRAENEEYKRTNSVVGLLSQTYRKMSKEQRAANQDLAKDINTLRDSLKAADASIGNFQRNVGNYPQMLRQITAVVPGLRDLTGQVNQIATALQGIKTSASAAGASIASTVGVLGTLGIVLGAGAVAYKVFRDSMELTQTVGDAVKVSVAGWTSVWEEFVRMIATADFSNFIQNLVNAKNVGEEVATLLDELFERNNALSIQRAESAKEQQQRLIDMRDQTKTLEERIAAADAYIAKEKELVDAEKDIAQQEYDAHLKAFKDATKLSEEEITDFIRNYDKKRDIIKKYTQAEANYNKAISLEDSARYITDKTIRDKSLAEAAQYRKEWQDVQSEIDETTRKTINQYNSYNKANDQLTENLVKAWVKRDTAEANGLARTRRAETMRNSLAAQTQKEEISAANQTVKAKQDESDKVREIQNRLYLESLSDRDRELELLRQKFEQERALLEAAGESTVALAENYAQKRLDVIAKYSKIDTKSILSELDAEMAEKQATIDAAFESGELAPVATSAFARWLGVSDEEFKQIKSQALQFAQQLYSELEQLARDSIQRRLDDELDALDRETESKKAALKKQADDGVISQKTYERRLSEIDKEAAAKQEGLKKEAFEEQKKWNLANAAMNGALAITNLLATVPGGQLNPAFWVALVFTTMTTLAQTAMIASQKYARGGLLQGASHAQGGIKGSVQGNNIELEGGEVVINKRSSAMFRRELSAINSYNGWGQKFAAGGELPKRFKFAEGGQLPSFAPAPLPAGADTGGFAQAIDAMNKRNDQLERAIYAIERQVVNIRAHVVYDDIESTGNDIRVAVERTSL